MQLSERQQKTVAIAATIVAGLIIASAALGLFWLLAKFVRTYSHVFLPLAVAGIAALVCQPYYELLRERLRLPVPLAIVALFLSVLIPIGLFFAFFGSVIVNEVVNLCQQIPIWWRQMLAQIDQHWPEVKSFLSDHPLGQRVTQTLDGMGPMVVSALEQVATTSVRAGSGLFGWTASAFSWAVAPVYFVFILTMPRQDISQIGNYLPFLKEETRKDVVYLVREFINIMVAFFRGQFIIAFLQGVLLAIGFRLVGLQYGIVLGLLLGFLNVIPYLGSMVGLSITLPLAYFQNEGGGKTLASVLVVLGVVQLIEGYVLTPKIMGDRTGLHPMVIIFAIFFWGSALGGVLGMILAIPLTAFLVVLLAIGQGKVHHRVDLAVVLSLRRETRTSGMCRIASPKSPSRRRRGDWEN